MIRGNYRAGSLDHLARREMTNLAFYCKIYTTQGGGRYFEIQNKAEERKEKE